MQEEGEEHVDMINQGLEEMEVKLGDETDIEGLKEMKAKVGDETDIEGIEGRHEYFFCLRFSANKILLDESTKKLYWSIARSKFEVFNSKLVKDAASFAIKVHKGKVVDHLIGAATRLDSSFNWDIIVASGLLQDSLSDSKMRYEDLEMNFGREVADLVTDVSKLTKLSETSGEDLGNSKHMLDRIFNAT